MADGCRLTVCSCPIGVGQIQSPKHAAVTQTAWITPRPATVMLWRTVGKRTEETSLTTKCCRFHKSCLEEWTRTKTKKATSQLVTWYAQVCCASNVCVVWTGRDEKEIFRGPLTRSLFFLAWISFFCAPFFRYCDRQKGNRLLISLKYCSVKSLNVYIFIVSGSTLLAQWASCQGDLLASHKNSLALGKRTGVLSCPGGAVKCLTWASSVNICIWNISTIGSYCLLQAT